MRRSSPARADRRSPTSSAWRKRTLGGELSPAHSVAAIGGLDAAAQGLQAVIERRFAGKVVLFPHLRDLPLLGLDELAQVLPRCTPVLAPGNLERRRRAGAV